MTNGTKCEGKRRMQRGKTFGLFKCGRKPTAIVTTNVGYSRTHLVCDDGECWSSITHGYPASSRAI